MKVSAHPIHHSPRKYADIECDIDGNPIGTVCVPSEFRRAKEIKACTEHLADLRRVHAARQPPPPPPPPPPIDDSAVALRFAAALSRRLRKDAERAATTAPTNREPRCPKIRDIQLVVASYFETTTFEICSRRRTAEIVRPRQIAMLLSKRLTPSSLTEISRLFGGRDHTTVLHGVHKFEALTRSDPQWAELVEAIAETIKALT